MTNHPPIGVLVGLALIAGLGQAVAATGVGGAPPRPPLRIDPPAAVVVVVNGPKPWSVKPPWATTDVAPVPRYPFMADPRRWPQVVPNTTQGTLSLNPITHRHWWED